MKDGAIEVANEKAERNPEERRDRPAKKSEEMKKKLRYGAFA